MDIRPKSVRVFPLTGAIFNSGCEALTAKSNHHQIVRVLALESKNENRFSLLVRSLAIRLVVSCFNDKAILKSLRMRESRRQSPVHITDPKAISRFFVAEEKY